MIAARVAELGKRIGADYSGRELVLVGMLKGATVFLADLLRTIPGAVRFAARSSS
jgi:hypoxanthine phosphoribosyltransferase